MDFPSEIKTIKSTNEFRIKEKGSEFIGLASPIKSIDEAEALLDSKKKEFYNASHNCFAYKLVSGEEKYSDDGEPNGTAGIRILNAIQHFDVTNLIVIVTRYFGGTKLGVGPLGKAYYNSAFGAINSTAIITKKNYSLFDIAYDFEHSKTVHHFLNSHSCIIKENKFLQRPVISFLIQSNEIENFKTDINNSTKRSSEIKLLDEVIFI